MTFRLISALCWLTLLFSPSALAEVAAQQTAAASITNELETVVKRNFELTQAEDIDGVLATVHTKSPIYAGTRNALQQINSIYDLKYELLDFHYIGLDGRYAYARFNLKTVKVSGPAFRNNELSILAAFKKEEGVWKFWNQANLDIAYEEPVKVD